jgi:predicted AlkP superfamily pyrophosphatase or phosphodiesterase
MRAPVRSLLVVLTVAVTGLTTMPIGATQDRTAAAGGPDTADDAVRHVVAISVDGLATSAITRLGRAGTPAMHRMMTRGAFTLNARTLHESTETLPNHTGMVTGRRVRASAGGHGVDFNEDDGRTVHAAAGHYVSCVFSVVHDRGLSTALFAGKDKFNLLDRSWSERFGAADRVGADQGRDKIDTYVREPNTDLLVGRMLRRLRTSPPAFTLLHIRLPDGAGHEHGYLSRPYLQAVRSSDALVARVLSTVTRRTSLRRHTVVVLTADHGGRRGQGSTSHSDPRLLGNYRIPFLVWGESVARGADLYALNGDRRRPADRRTTYRGRQPVRNAEVANLATDLLDLPAVPGSGLDAGQGLDVQRR